jgi:drug/metabolite transporter (DMT)-like permease
VIGEICALSAALTWALALVLFKRSGETIPPFALNLFKNVVTLVLLGGTILLLGRDSGALRSYPQGDYAILILSGVIGIALADTVFFYSLNLLGVGIVAIVDCLYSPFVILFAHLLLDERLSPPHYLGTGMILSAVLLASRHAPPADRTRRQIALGVVLGATSMALMTFGIVIAKPVLDGHDFPLIWGATIRMVAGTVFLAAAALLLPRWRAQWRFLRPSAAWRFSLPATLLGSYLAMLFWVAGFKFAQASIAGVLNQTSTVFALLLATLILKEPFTPRKAVATIMAVAGVVIVTVS